MKIPKPFEYSIQSILNDFKSYSHYTNARSVRVFDKQLFIRAKGNASNDIKCIEILTRVSYSGADQFLVKHTLDISKFMDLEFEELCIEIYHQLNNKK